MISTCAKNNARGYKYLSMIKSDERRRRNYGMDYKYRFSDNCIRQSNFQSNAH